LHLAINPNSSGPYNLVAPEALTNRNFTKALGESGETTRIFTCAKSSAPVIGRRNGRLPFVCEHESASSTIAE
jgi:NAD dependent epimerase/dehydratase family enzyme